MTDKGIVAEKLRAHKDRISNLMTVVENPALLTAPQKARAQAQMKSIKEKLNADYALGATVGGQKRLSAAEKAYFHPAVHHASTAIRARWNSNPMRSNWYAELYEARIDIEFFLNQLVDETAK